jgi:ankyrin repeat protein
MEAEAPVNMRDQEGMTPLILALENGFRGIQLLLSHGAAINAFNAKGEMPLHVAARGNRPDAIRLLLRYGADPAVFSRLGWTPLHVAALHNSVEAADVLLESGVNADQVNEREQTPMHCAVRNSRPEIIALLIQFGSAVDPVQAAQEADSRPTGFVDYQNRIVRAKTDQENRLKLTIQDEKDLSPEPAVTGQRKEIEKLFNLYTE